MDFKYHFIFPAEIMLPVLIWLLTLKKNIELTVPYRKDVDWEHQHKLEKYKDLGEEIYKIKLDDQDIFYQSFQGFIVNTIWVYLNSVVNKRGEVVLKDFNIGKRLHVHAYTMWEKPNKTGDIMRYLLGAHWINSNVLTLKPCMTPEPLFDEGFVRSTAAVFTAIVVQIYKYRLYLVLQQF